MADDRIIIRCTSCSAWKMLHKHYAGLHGTSDNGILEWIDSHMECHPRFYEHQLKHPGFELLTESQAKDLDFSKQNIMADSRGGS